MKISRCLLAVIGLAVLFSRPLNSFGLSFISKMKFLMNVEREKVCVSVSVRERERSACNTECSLFNDFALFVLSVLGPKSKQAVPPVTIAMHTAAVAFSPTYK